MNADEILAELGQHNLTDEDLIEGLAGALALQIARHPGALRPHAVNLTSEAFVKAANLSVGLDNLAEFFGVFRELDPEVFGQLLMEQLGHPDEVRREDKMRALAIADHMGSDWAQKLYRFAVLVTKLA